MKALIALSTVILLSANAAVADATRRARIAEILASFPAKGTRTVSLSECILTIQVSFSNCREGSSVVEIYEVIDLRIISNTAPRVSIERDGRSHLFYEISLLFAIILRQQDVLFDEILRDGRDLYPSDVEGRGKYFEQRYRAEIDPKNFSVKSETMRFCDGTSFARPNGYNDLLLNVPTNDRDEFAGLFSEEIATDCEAKPSG